MILCYFVNIVQCFKMNCNYYWTNSWTVPPLKRTVYSYYPFICGQYKFLEFSLPFLFVFCGLAWCCSMAIAVYCNFLWSSHGSFFGPITSDWRLRPIYKWFYCAMDIFRGLKPRGRDLPDTRRLFHFRFSLSVCVCQRKIKERRKENVCLSLCLHIFMCVVLCFAFVSSSLLNGCWGLRIRCFGLFFG